MIDPGRVRLAATAGYVVAGAGAGALAAYGLFAAGVAVFGPIGDVLLIVMTLAIAPIMLGSYELGGVTPLWPARFSLAAGTTAVVIWSTVQLTMILGLVAFDYESPARGAFGIEAIAVIVMGAWITGAPPLAGPWLPQRLRWLGAISGLGFIVFGFGLVRGGVNDPLTITGGIGYQILFPIWAFLYARLLRTTVLRRSA